MTLETGEDLMTFTWVRLRAGVEPHDVRRQLKLRGLSDPQVEDLMQEAYEGRRPVADVSYSGLANIAITRRALHHPDIRKVPVAKAQVYVWKNFLLPEACDAVVALIDQRLRDSTTTDAFADPKIRTSRTSDIGMLGHDLIMQLDELMAEAIGIHWSYTDVTQGQRYDLDQEYKAHYDYFVPGTREHQVFCQFTGQRTWTFMIYLNDVVKGGETRFDKLGLQFQPSAGLALCWRNLLATGEPNQNALHSALPVLQGTKYIITKWFREKPGRNSA